MKYGIVVTDKDPRRFAAAAREAEEAGWDAVFSWESVSGLDAWVALSAAAVATERIRLGTMLTPLSRWRPWDLARVTTSLDLLSGGRVILPVGLGAVMPAWTAFEPDEGRRTRAELVDENIDILRGLWSGEPFTYEGRHHHVRPPDPAAFAPPPTVQRPGIPIWCVGLAGARRSMARAARCDGLLPNIAPPGAGAVAAEYEPTVAELAGAAREVLDLRAEAGLHGPYDIVAETGHPLRERARAVERGAELAEAGYTWFVDSYWDAMGTDEAAAVTAARIAAGPLV
ncbi:LLM class flavin-dependent oxidoreductase [Tsukamurella sp. 8F]|uniref:LLM class flavin-dependent oxidoreductase n=1 Tax=unclassified Tsukamurella TaxID=2633480 RepID=UPI0023B91DED|nr:MULTISPECIES: LLM class flavin-dependent oxidoreductase [unclassified Tsukamurella]MDF0531949.1 LLM class flavin-dependent oxidoreductase [Tsukamurella sp. 8J]MDF0588000.1 LLM class flavin-dependent oxidoreductase [Tsukamurella sp. 8F]